MKRTEAGRQNRPMERLVGRDYILDRIAVERNYHSKRTGRNDVVEILDECKDEILKLRDALKLKTAGDEYAHRLAVMLECALLDRRGTWDDGHALLAEYRSACAMADEPPTFMGEPVLTPN